jgi:RimJ/RimL family protein N-acetyltransferase
MDCGGMHRVLEPPTLAGPDLHAVELGWTWLAGSAQGTGINLEAKLRLFTYAFETLGVVASI